MSVPIHHQNFYTKMMDLVKAKGNNKKGMMIRTWERCRSFSGVRSKNTSSNNNNNNNNISGIRRALVKKSKSWSRLNSKSTLDEDYKGRIAPEGCFSVYVGPQKQRFLIKTEYVNHPRFKVLLEEAESKYGYHTQGSLALPCNVEMFLKVLLEMDDSDHDIIQKGCTFTRSASSTYRLL